MAQNTPDTCVEHEVGGIVWRDGRGGKELGLVRTQGTPEWTLPYGKPDGGQYWHDMARIVVERKLPIAKLRVIGFAGQLCSTASRPSDILFWNMVPVSSRQQRQNDATTAEFHWVPYVEALQKLDTSQQALITATHEIIVRRKGLHAWLARRRRRPLAWLRPQWQRSLSYRRLETALPVYQAELEHLHDLIYVERQFRAIKKAAAPSTPCSEVIEATLKDAFALLHDANQALDEGNAELGWRCFNGAQRIMLYALPGPEFKAKTNSIRCEASQKLKPDSWRRKQIEHLLTPNEQFNSEVERGAAFYAALLLHEHFDNRYHKLNGIREQLKVLSIVGVITLIALVTVLLWHSPSPLPAAGRGFVAAVVLLGITGACISGILSFGKDADDGSIPDQLLNSWIILTRPAVGAIAAVAMYIILQSGIINVFDADRLPGVVLAAAFAAGFSERLLKTAVEKAVAKVGQ